MVVESETVEIRSRRTVRRLPNWHLGVLGDVSRLEATEKRNDWKRDIIRLYIGDTCGGEKDERCSGRWW